MLALWHQFVRRSSKSQNGIRTAIRTTKKATRQGGLNL
jgi:hypothetical protein